MALERQFIVQNPIETAAEVEVYDLLTKQNYARGVG